MIFTFYSFKGGVGRSMALANVAEILYQKGLKVLIVDFDLEAPGLDRYFSNSSDKYSDLLSKRGIVDLLQSYKDLSSLPSFNHAQSSKFDSSDNNEGFAYLVEPLSNFITSLYEESINGGSLSMITAGRREGKDFSNYVNSVQSFDWNDFYINWHGQKFFEWFRTEAEAISDVVLIDSRTGITEMGGVSAYQLADAVIIFVAPNQQNLDGVLMMAKSLSNPELVEKGRNGRKISLIFVPSRVEHSEAKLLDNFAKQFDDMLTPFTSSEIKFKKMAFSDLKIPYVPYYAYNEEVVARDPDKASASDLIEAFNRLAYVMAQLASKDSAMFEKYIKLTKYDESVSSIKSLCAEGTSILTSATGLEYPFEKLGESQSAFLDALIYGIQSGKADLNSDGIISIDELYQFICYELKKKDPSFPTPNLAASGIQNIAIAMGSKSISENESTVNELPKELVQGLESPFSSIRLASLNELQGFVHDKKRKSAVQQALNRLAKDESVSVADAASKALKRFNAEQMMPPTSGFRFALIIANSVYEDESFQVLTPSDLSTEKFGKILGDPNIGDFEVKMLTNQPIMTVMKEIESFFREHSQDDSLLLYFSGLMMSDDNGRLFFIASDTIRKFLMSTAIPMDFVKDILQISLSKKKVLIINCPFSGRILEKFSIDKILGNKDRSHSISEEIYSKTDYCNVCGAKLSSADKFCGICGEPAPKQKEKSFWKFWK